MKNKYIGETIRYETVLKDRNGTALNSESPTLSVNDSGGTNVLSANGTYDTAGTYYHEGAIGTGWNAGPVTYNWSVKGNNGTALDVLTNELFVISGTLEPSSYVYSSELTSYYTNIDDYFNEHTQDKLVSVYHKINRRLEAQNIKAPRDKNPDGLHDQALRDWNANWGIYYIIQDWEGNRAIEGEEEPWYKKYWDEGERIYTDIKKRKILFRDQVTPADAGIGKPSRTAGSSIATMVTNWDNSYGKGFKGSDYERTWTLEVIGTGTNGEIGEALLAWSKDGGISNAGTVTSSKDWVAMGDEVYVRWTRGTSTGTTDLWQVGDKWSFKTQPIKGAVRGMRTAKSY